MTTPIDVSPAAAGGAPDAVLTGLSAQAIEGRSLGQIAWLRLRRDKVAMAGGGVVAFLILVAVVGPHLVQNPTTYHANLINATFSRPYGPLGGFSLAHPLRVEPITGRDVLSRIVNGAQSYLLIAFLPTALAVSIGGFLGIIAVSFGVLVLPLLAPLFIV